MRHQECFALREDIDGMLDLARKTVMICVSDLHEVALSYTDTHFVQSGNM
jgi:hypothetical protein